MYRSPSRYGPRPPSLSRNYRRGQFLLSIRTAGQQPQQATQNEIVTSPTKISHTDFPLPIPAEKQKKALILYRRYIMVSELEELEQRQHEHRNSYLDVPGRPQSVISCSSSQHKRTASVSPSTNDGMTELDSILSFDGDEALSINAKGALSSSNGSSVKQPRIRRPFPPAKRAKTALIRWIGSCKRCQPRKVPCSIDHHDFKSLLLRAASSNPQSPSPNQDTVHPSQSKQHINTSLGESEALLGLSQNNALAGIGDKYSLADEEPIAATLDIQSPDSYGYTQVPDFRSVGFVAPIPVTEFPTSLNYMYQNSGMFPLGLFDGFYVCQYSSGDSVCGQMLVTDEDLQQHFLLDHFDFTRIYPAHRYVCSQCKQFSNDLHGPCYSCGVHGSIQMWLYGNYVHTPDFSSHAPDGHDLQRFDTYTTILPPMPNIDWTTGLDPFGGNAGPTDMRNGDLYGNHGSQSYDFNSSSEAEPEGSQFIGSSYGGARQFAIGIPQLARLGSVKLRQLITKNRINILLFLAMVILALGFSLSLTICKAEAHYRSLSYRFQAQLPIVGFMVFLVSFVVSLLAKYLRNKRLRRWSQYVNIVTTVDDIGCKTNQNKRRCPLHSITNASQTPKCRSHGFDTRAYIS